MSKREISSADLFDSLCNPGACQSGVPSCAIIVAHPDDEIVGAGSLLPLLEGCTIVHTTDGAPRNLHDAVAAGFSTREDYSKARLREAHAALALAGIKAEQVRQLGFVDQESSYSLVAMARSLVSHLGELRPEIILTHPYEGGHPDHDSTAFAVHAACRILRQLIGCSPAIAEMAFYHRRESRMVVGEFLTPAGQDSTECVQILRLDPSAQRLKQQMFACHASQTATLQNFDLEKEWFRPAPEYDFQQAPHDGSLLYEWYDWGMTGERWRDLAQAAYTQFDLQATTDI